jgi:hypothetical protein
VGGVCIKNIPDTDPEFTYDQAFRSTKEAASNPASQLGDFAKDTDRPGIPLFLYCETPQVMISD